MSKIVNISISAVLAAWLVLVQQCPAALPETVDLKCSPSCRPGRWSRLAADLLPGAKGVRSINIYSNNPNIFIHAAEESWWVEAEHRRINPNRRNSYLGYPAESAWASDNRAFYLTQSEGSETGFHTDVFIVRDGELHEVPAINSVVVQDFERRHKCSFISEGHDIGNKPNVAGLRWTEGSKQLLIVAEVPPVGLCDQLEYFGGYLIAIPSGKVLARYSPQQLVDGWSEVLGDRLKSNFHYLSANQKNEIP